MIKGLFRFVGGFFRFLLLGLDILRRVLVNVVFLLVLGVLIVLIWRPEPSIPDGSALVLRPSGTLVEQRRLEAPLDLLRLGRSVGAQSALHSLVDAVRAARDDERISALVINTDDLSQTGVSKLSELRAAIEYFRTSGKPVYARGERFSQGQYYLASAADEVHMSPDGFVLLRGLSRYVSYFKDALDKLGVNVHVFRVGEYKSFSEPFTRTDMSEHDRENTEDLLAGIWNVFRSDVAAGRGLEADALDRYIVDFAGRLSAAGGDAARAAFDAGLVDGLSTRDQWRSALRERFGEGRGRDDFRGVSVSSYLNVINDEPRPQDRVAVLVAQGAIMDGSGTPGSVGGDSFARKIRDAREDPTVRALVVRIDSPGGSAWASEQIRRELEITRRAGKPVIASMSSTAASGGYWVAAGADEIWAHPLTLTGSIGIFAMVPEFSQTLERIGITTDGVATSPLAGAVDPRRPLGEEAREALQIAIEHGYRRFLETVAEARDMSVAEVELAASGRVWTGEAASKLGLVDELGGLHDAVVAAAGRAGLERYAVVWPGVRLSPRALLLQRLADFIPPDEPESRAAPSSLGFLLTGLKDDAEALLAWNDPQHLYVHCLCEGP